MTEFRAMEGVSGSKNASLKAKASKFGVKLPAGLFVLLCGMFILSGLNEAFPQSRMELRAKLIGKSPAGFTGSEPAVVGRKSPMLAALASMAVPGLGELYAGRYDIGKYSTITEVSLWVLYTGLELYSDQVRNDAINYARLYSGAQVAGKPGQFFVDIGNFLNTSDYNVKKVHDGYYGLIYTSPSDQWQWQSDANRTQFKSLRIKADTYLNYGRYALAVIFLNHLVSAIDAGRLAANFNASAATSVGGLPNSEGIYLKLAAGF